MAHYHVVIDAGPGGPGPGSVSKRFWAAEDAVALFEKCLEPFNTPGGARLEWGIDDDARPVVRIYHPFVIPPQLDVTLRIVHHDYGDEFCPLCPPAGPVDPMLDLGMNLIEEKT